MRKGLVLSALLCGLAAVMAFNFRTAIAKVVPFPFAAEEQTASEQILVEPAGSNLTPREAREALATAYRLQPDRRFTLAVADIHSLLTGEERRDVSVEFEGSRWQIAYAGEEAGSLPELPDFGDAMSLLDKWTSHVLETHPIDWEESVPDSEIEAIEKELNGFMTRHAVSAVQKIDLLWREGHRDPRLIALAARGLTYINMQAMDRLEIADNIPTRALALVAITGNLQGEPLAQEEALLAVETGYRKHAVSAARQLAKTDPVRLYVVGNDGALEDFAENPQWTTQSRYLLMAQTASKGDLEMFMALDEEYFPEPVISLGLQKLGIESSSFALRQNLAAMLPYMILFRVAEEAAVLPELESVLKRIFEGEVSQPELVSFIKHVFEALGQDEESLVKTFESGLEILEPKYKGPFLDFDTYRNYYMGHFTSSLEVLGLHYLDNLSSAPAAEAFSRMLEGADSGIMGDINIWYKHLALSKSGSVRNADLFNDFADRKHLGGAPLIRTYWEQSEYFTYADTAAPRAAKALVHRLDTRPGHRATLLYIVENDLVDLNLTMKLASSLFSTYDNQDEDTFRILWYASFMNDNEKLVELIESPNLKPPELAQAITTYKGQDDYDPVVVLRAYEKLVKEEPREWNYRSIFIYHLIEQEEYERARDVARDWKSMQVETDGLERIMVMVAIAKTYYLEGNYKLGIVAIQPALDSWQGGALNIAAKLFQKDGLKTKAKSIAEAALGRYPDSLYARETLVQIHWENGEYEDAAKLLHEAHPPISISDWQFEIGPLFYETFAELSHGETIAAFTAIKDRGIEPFTLSRLALPFGKAGHYEIAFDLMAPLEYSGPGVAALHSPTYGYLTELHGKEKALEWFKKKIPSHMLNATSMAFFEQKEYDLLWEIIEQPELGEYPNFVWLTRAAASVKTGHKNTQYHALLIEYYGKNRTDYYDRIARYLLDLETEAQVFSLATDPKKVCEVSFYAGLKAESEGRFHEASDWYRVCVETGLDNNGEYGWAYTRLWTWYSKGKSLDYLVAEYERGNADETVLAQK